MLKKRALSGNAKMTDPYKFKSPDVRLLNRIESVLESVLVAFNQSDGIDMQGLGISGYCSHFIAEPTQGAP